MIRSARNLSRSTVTALLCAVLAAFVPAVAGAQTTSAVQRTVERTISAHTATFDVTGTNVTANRFVKLENLGQRVIHDAKLHVAGRDWSTIDTMLAAIVTADMTPERKARAIWQFARQSRYHWYPPDAHNPESADPIKHFNSYGYGLCSDTSAAMAALFSRAGFQVRLWNPGNPPAHVVPEVFYDGRWHMFDADRDGLYLLRDNRTVAGVEDLIHDPGLVTRAGAAHEDLVTLYAQTPLSAKTTWVDSPTIDLGVSLRPDEDITLYWTPRSNARHAPEHPAPPIYGNGELVSHVDAWAPDPARWLSEYRHVDVGQFGGATWFLGTHPVEEGTLAYTVDSLHPIVGGSLSTEVLVPAADDVVEIYTSRGIGLAFTGNEVASGAILTSQYADGYANVATVYDDGAFPLVHSAVGLVPSRLQYRLTRASLDQPVRISTTFYRYATVDETEIALSLDGTTWETVWTPGADQSGYFQASADITSRLGSVTTFFVRLQWRAVSGDGGVNFTAGLADFAFAGVVPESQLIWSSVGRTGRFPLDLDLSPAIAPQDTAATHAYALRVVVRSPRPATTGITGLTLTSMVQVSPFMLPAVAAGPTTFVYRDRSTEETRVRLTQSWTELVGAHRPAAPVPIDRLTHVLQPFKLAWRAAVDPDGAADIIQYHVMICADINCESPLSSVFDAMTAFLLSPGTDQVAGTPDDIVAPNRSTNWTVSQYDWFAAGRTYYWRVRAQDSTGLWSGFSPIRPLLTTSESVPSPTLDVTGPMTRTSTAPFVTLEGDASSAAGLRNITWSSDRGPNGSITTSGGHWQFANIPLVKGENRITVVAADANGMETTAEIVVTVNVYRYLFAEGVTGDFFDTDLAIGNPNDVAAPVALRFLTQDGTVVSRDLVVPALARRTLRLDEDPELLLASFGIEVTSLDALPLAVDRTILWGDDRAGGHMDTAATGEGTRWYFAEGSQGFYETFLLLANMGDNPATVLARFLTESQTVVERTYVVDPHTRLTVLAAEVPEIVGQSFATELVSDLPIVAERAMYFGPGWIGGHVSGGVREPSTTWFHAEGATGSYFTSFILIGNPNAEPAAVTVDYLTDDGARIRRVHQVAPQSRLTLNIATEDAALASANVATTIQADRPVIAERVTYWPGAPQDWQDASGSFGSTAVARRWAVGDIRVGGARGYQSYVLLANNTADAADVRVRLLRVAGPPLERSIVVNPSSRRNLNINELFPEFRDVECSVRIDVTNGVPIAAERALYWDTPFAIWAGGASALAVPLP
jgi:hypothetical protein